MARAVEQAVLETFPKDDLSLSVVWIDILAGDGAKGAANSSGMFDDDRVRQFHDTSRIAGRAMAPLIGMPTAKRASEHSGEPIAVYEERFKKDFVHGAAAVFDTLFLFDADATWKGTSPPKPKSWVTQLDPGMWVGIDIERFRYGDALEAEIKKLTGALLKKAKGD